jgi:hypothetical protein
MVLNTKSEGREMQKISAARRSPVQDAADSGRVADA